MQSKIKIFRLFVGMLIFQKIMCASRSKDLHLLAAVQQLQPNT